MFIGHIGVDGRRLHQHIPFPLDLLGTRYEYLAMKIIGWLSEQEFFYRYAVTRRFIDFLAHRVVLPIIHGEVLTPDEVGNLVRRLEAEGALMALGICECRHGQNNIASELEDGRDPNFTCVMIGDWGKGHIYNYPDLYRTVGAEELVEKLRFWHERGRVLNGWGFRDSHGFVVSYCHCMPHYCVPLKNQLTRGTTVFTRGNYLSEIDAGRCCGPEECAKACPGRCHFGAISVVGGKAVVDSGLCMGCGQCFCYCPTGAAHAVRRQGHEMLYYTRDLVAPMDAG